LGQVGLAKFFIYTSKPNVQTAPGLSHSVTRPHLRNLFFRSHTLLSLDILPVIVLDGACPEAKSATVQARNRARGAGGFDSPKRQHRRQFKGVLNDCLRLAESLGVPCVRAPGEAEAYCAWLDRAGLVDAVVSDDSDCFCYGAKTVLRNFSTDPKNFSVTRCTAKRLREELGLSRQRLVVMALLLGSDYNPGGVAGVGRDGVAKLFALWGAPNKQVGEEYFCPMFPLQELGKVLSWRDTGEEEPCGKPVHCGTCGHPGSLSTHRKAGCAQCGNNQCKPSAKPCSCDYHSPKHQLHLAESFVRRKAVASPGWPFQHVVDEFYSEPPVLPPGFTWARPKPGDFCQVATVKMDWVRDYCVEKVLEVVVRWQVKHPTTLAVSPITVLKKRVKAGEAMLEVEWAKTCPPCLCSTSKYPCTMPATFAACVPTVDFSEAFPEVFHNFQAKLDAKEAAKKKPKSKKGKENVEDEGLESKGKKKRATKKKADEKQPMISDFVQSEVQGQIGEDESLDRPKNIVFKKLVSKDKAFNNKVISSKMLTPKEVDPVNVEKEVEKEDEELGDSFVLRTVPSKADKEEDSNEDLFTDSVRQFMDSGDDSDLSDIIDDIIGAKKEISNRSEIGEKLHRPKNFEVAKLLESNLADSMEMMNISGSPSALTRPASARFPREHSSNHPATPSSALLLPDRLTCTSTPASANQMLLSKRNSVETSKKFTFSPPGFLSRKTPAILTKASDVFDISDSFMVMDIDTPKVNRSVGKQSETRTGQVQILSTSERPDNMMEDGEDSFDRFDLATQETPFAERVKKRMYR